MRRILRGATVLVLTLITCLMAVLAVMPLERWFEEYPHELVRMGAEYDLQQGGRLWSLHLGAYRGGVYLLWDVRLLPPGDARFVKLLKQSPTREWHFGNEMPFSFIYGYDAVGAYDYLEPDWRAWGFRRIQYPEELRPAGYGRGAVVPVWLLMILTGILPVMWLITKRRRQMRRRAGRCPNCGYDLRASPDLCPECGQRQGK